MVIDLYVLFPQIDHKYLEVSYASLDLTGLRFLTVFNKCLRWQWWPQILSQELSTNCMLSSVLVTRILKWRNYWIIQQIFILIMHSSTFRSLFLCPSENRGNIQRIQKELNFGAKYKTSFKNKKANFQSFCLVELEIKI